MTWRDNLRAASSEDGFIIAGGSGASLIPQNTNWHDNYMNSFTEDGIKIANLKDAVSQVETLPQEADTGSLYYLTTGANPGMYYYDGTEWVAVGGGGGGGPTVVQTIGNSTTDVMSQDATTKMIWQDVAAGQKVIRIGNSSTDNYAFNTINIGAQYARSNESVAIGSSAQLYGNSSGSVIIGGHAHTPTGGAAGSVAIGYQAGSNIDHAGMVDFGTTNTYYGYDSNSNYRVITGVHDAQNAHDAVTLGQLNALITELQSLGLNVSLQGASNAGQNSGSSENPGTSAEPDPGTAEQTVTCPFCGQQTPADSTVCQICGNDISGGAIPDPGEEPGPEIPPEEPTEEPVEG